MEELRVNSRLASRGAIDASLMPEDLSNKFLDSRGRFRRLLSVLRLIHEVGTENGDGDQIGGAVEDNRQKEIASQKKKSAEDQADDCGAKKTLNALVKVGGAERQRRNNNGRKDP